MWAGRTSTTDMPSRRYDKTNREAAAMASKERVLDSTMKLLRATDNVTAVSLDVVAKAAGVTRLTVYNQFGSRRRLLEAVLDRVAQDAGFDRLRDVLGKPDPVEALNDLIDIICHAWGSDPCIAPIHAAAAIDAEFADAVGQRMERRRMGLRSLVMRMVEQGLVPAARSRDLVDTLYALTTFQLFASLREGRRSAASVSAIMRSVCTAAIQALAEQPVHRPRSARRNRAP